MTRGECEVCQHMDVKTVDRFLVSSDGTPGKRGPRSLAPVFGLDRRAIARHEKRCLVGGRREEVERGIRDLAGKRISEHQRRERR